MLNPHDRRLLLDALRPPEGYAFDEGIGTTFTLDLVAMLTAPLGFTMLELQDSVGSEIGETDALVLLRTIRQYADRLTIFCQGGRIAVPRGQVQLLANLEESVVEVKAPIRGGVFHPKVWALRYVREGEPVRYRLLVLSRNLTFDRSWDTALVLDGVLRDRVNAIARSRPLGNFFDALPAMAIRTVGEGIGIRVQRFAHELRRVDFQEDLPPGVTELDFHPLGLAEGKRPPSIAAQADRLMVISPFIDRGELRVLAEAGRGDVLISRVEELGKVPRETLSMFERVFCLSPAAVESLDTGSSESGAVPDAGLHAKVYVAERGWNAHVWTGSANATSAAFRRNVEFLVELTGRRKDLGIDTILAEGDRLVTLRSLLLPYEPPAEPLQEDANVREAEDRLDAARLAIAGAGWSALVTSATPDGHDVVLAPDATVALPEGIESVRVHPVMMRDSAARPPSDGLRFEFRGLTTAALTSFFAFELTARVNDASLSCRFVVNADLRGAPADRREAVLRSLLRDRRQVIRFLLLLLADDDQVIHGEVNVGSRTGGGSDGSLAGDGTESLLETLLRTLVQAPERLDDVARLVRDLQATETPEDPLVPPGLREILDPILAAREVAR